MTFLESLFTIILFLNILMAIASFIFAYILLRRAKGNAIYFNFGMSALFLALWITVTFLAYFPIGVFTITFWILLSYFFGLGIMHFFLMFTYKYPVSKDISRANIFIIYTASILVALTLLVPDLYVLENKLDFPFMYEEDNPIGLTIFSIYFVILEAMSFVNLGKYYIKCFVIFKKNLKKIIIGTGVAVVANLIFSLFIYYFSNFQSTSIGVLFTFGVLLYIYSILFSRRSEV